MPTMVDLLQSILEENRRSATTASQLQSADVARQNAGIQGQSAQFDLEQKQRGFDADMALAKRSYPDLDPLEALIRWKADEKQQDQSLKDESIRSLQAQREAYAHAAEMRATATQDKLTVTPEEQKAIDLKNERERAALERDHALTARILQQLSGKYNPDSANPDAPKAGKAPKYEVNDNEWKSARADLAAEGNTKPTTQQIRQRAVLKKYGVDLSAAEAGPSGVPEPPAPPPMLARDPNMPVPSQPAAGGCPAGTRLAIGPGGKTVCVRVQ